MTAQSVDKAVERERHCHTLLVESNLAVPNKPGHDLLNLAVSLIGIGLEDTPPAL